MLFPGPAAVFCLLQMHPCQQLCSSTVGPEFVVALQAHSPHAAWRPPHTVLLMNTPGTQALRCRDSRGFAASPPVLWSITIPILILTIIFITIETVAHHY
ncbi:unnamed protein product [Rangifer tarandus platyrhynchus]|uniref:Uncharacterized protein n=2 Tax=Rangifer tarandus platyrhynchus TaxID=3082113 RepID=A0ACB0F3S5_RANTA|nr:unnamed protein product [Rangifer tarandus platyrhynchus]CAI9707509.1 unnamed protein product [Rangifer tarandus platyrhynchus]